jgi:hypothetical protein
MKWLRPKGRNAPPSGWHPPMAAPADLKARLSPKETRAFITRERISLQRSVRPPIEDQTSRLIKNANESTPIGIKDIDRVSPTLTTGKAGDSPTLITNEAGGFHSAPTLSRTGSDKAPVSIRNCKRHRSSTGKAWCFEPFPLSQREEKLVIKTRHWRDFNLRSGDYNVAPTRYDLKWIQRIFWAGREIRSALRAGLPYLKFIKNELLDIRKHIYLLGNGSEKKTYFQRKLFSDVYYCLRQCNRLQDDELALKATRRNVSS